MFGSTEQEDRRESQRRNRSGYNIRPSQPSPGSSTAYEKQIIKPAMLMSLKNRDLHKGFDEVQKKLAQILNAFENGDNFLAFIDPIGPVSIGIDTLRQIATSIIEKDPHFACHERVFENLWLMGFSLPLKLSHKFEASGKIHSASSIREWRTRFMLDWLGYLSKLEDTLELYQQPEGVVGNLPNLFLCLPPGYSLDKDPLSAYQLPLTYMLRDIALCIARVQSHLNPHLEKFWMQRALKLNTQLKGLPYTEVGTKTKHIEKPLEGSPVGIFARSWLKDPAFPEKADLNTQCAKLTSADSVEEVLSASGSEKDHGESENDYGVITAKDCDIQQLKAFAGRNSFIQGLVAAAKIQGIDVDSDIDDLD